MKGLLKYLKPYKKEVIVAPAFKLLEVVFELLVPLVVAQIIDAGARAGDIGAVRGRCALMVLLALVGFSCTMAAQWFAARAAVGFTGRVRSALFAHLQGLSYADLDRLGTSALITRMTSDMNQIQTGLNLTLRLLLRSPVVVFGAMIMAFTVDAQAALIFAVVIPVLFAVVFFLMLRSIPLYKKVQEKLDRLMGLTRENLTGVRVLRAFGREEEETETFRRENAAFAALQRRVGRLSALLNPLTYCILNLGVAALIRTGALRVNAGDLTTGQMVALYNYMSQILVELIKFANLIININRSLACAGRVSSVLAVQTSMADGNGEGEEPAGRVVFDRADLTYPGGGDPALTDITFTAEPGETVGIIGGTGAGKTSVVNLIPRFYDVTGGSVTVGGLDVREWKEESLRRRIGIVPQKAVLFSGTIRDNLKWGNEDASDEELLEAAARAQAADVIAGKGGLDAAVEPAGRNFSGGQKQRLCIARALARRPEILILDDSASALDMATDAALRESLKTQPGRPTVFIVSQRIASVRHADKILVLDDGRLSGCGTHEELLLSCPVYREICQSQERKEEAV